MSREKPHITAALMAFTGFSMWSISDAAVRFLQDFPVTVIAFWGSFLSMTMLLVCSKRLGGLKATFTMPQLKLRAVRGVLLAGSGLCSYYAFTQLDLATAYAIIFFAPLLAKVMSVFVTGENIRLRSWAITLLGFIGVLIVVRPGMVPINTGTIAALLLALMFSAGYVLSRYIKDENQTLLSMALFQYVILTVATAVPAYMAYQDMAVSFTMTDIFALIVISAPAVGGSILVAKAFSVAPTQIIAPIHYVQILWGTILGAVLFSEYPDLWTIIGGGVICVAGLLLIRFSRKTI